VFPKHSAFQLTDDQQEYLEGVRQRALSTPLGPPRDESLQNDRESILREVHDIAEDYFNNVEDTR
jgi:hypothetical protein